MYLHIIVGIAVFVMQLAKNMEPYMIEAHKSLLIDIEKS